MLVQSLTPTFRAAELKGNQQVGDVKSGLGSIGGLKKGL